jgi:hypothetical protein
MLIIVITGVAAAAVAVLAARFELTHLHLLLVIPVGAIAMGVVIGAAVAASIRLTRSYDTTGVRMVGTVAGLAGYWGAVVLDFTDLSITLGPFTLRGTSVLNFPAYLTRMVRAQGQPISAFLAPWVTIPTRFDAWIGLGVIAIEMIGLVFAIGMAISYLGNVPYCRRDRRFFALREIIETRDEDLLNQWMRAVHERRPMEARNDFGRIRLSRLPGFLRGPRVRIAVHQCVLCKDSRVRIDRRTRRLGIRRTEMIAELWLDGPRAAMLG